MNPNILNTLSLFAKEKEPEIRNFRICAGVVYKHKDIVSIGFPRKKTHPIQKRFGCNQHSVYLHAEVEALIRAMKIEQLNKKDYSIYVARIKRPSATSEEFIPGNAAPCIGCQTFIKECGITITHHT